MKAMLGRAWRSRSPRERIVIAAVVALLGAASYLWLVHSATRARGQLGASVAALRTQAERLDQQAAEYERLRQVAAPAAAAGDLRALLQARADAARLSGALTRIESTGADHVSLTLGALPFADWLAWIAALQAQHVRLESARIEALAAPGQVSVTATFARSRPQ